MEKAASNHRRLMLAGAASAVVVGAATVFRSGSSAISYPHGSPLEVEISDLTEGKLRTVEWQGRPVWILRRSAQSVSALATHDPMLLDPESQHSAQPLPCRNRHRSLRPDIFVAVGLCTHQGCSPALLSADIFLCPCHASRYDLAGRVFNAGPASANLVIPAYRFEAADRLLLGVDA